MTRPCRADCLQAGDVIHLSPRLKIASLPENDFTTVVARIFSEVATRKTCLVLTGVDEHFQMIRVYPDAFFQITRMPK